MNTVKRTVRMKGKDELTEGIDPTLEEGLTHPKTEDCWVRDDHSKGREDRLSHRGTLLRRGRRGWAVVPIILFPSQDKDESDHSQEDRQLEGSDISRDVYPQEVKAEGWRGVTCGNLSKETCEDSHDAISP
jgi:hypothetical protein